MGDAGENYLKGIEAARLKIRRMQALLEGAHDLILVLDQNGCVKYQSPSVIRFLRTRRLASRPASVFEHLLQEDRPAAVEIFSRCLRCPGVEEEIELRVQLADQSWRLMDCKVKNLLDDAAVDGVVVYARDITAQRTTMASIHKLYLALEQNPVSIIVTDTLGNIDYVNSAFLGMSAPDEAEIIGEMFRKEVMVAPIRDEYGRKPHFIIIQKDLTQKNLESKEIARMNRRYQLFLDAAQEGILGLDSAGRIIVANCSTEKLLGFDSGKMLGCKGESIFHLEEEGGQSPILLTMKDGRTRKGQVDLFRRQDQTSVWVEYSCSKLQLSDEEDGCVVIFRDISEERKTQVELVHLSATLETRNWELVEARDRALEASRVRTHFLAGVSHELRTPLNAILGMTGLLSRSQCSDEQRELLDIIHGSGEMLLHLINNILDFAALEDVRMRLEKMSFEAWRLLEDCIGLFSSMAQHAGLELVCLIDPALPPALVGDPHRLRQVITNLLGNAVKFTFQGHVALSVRVESQDSHSVTLLFEILDSGMGIALDVQEKLFQPFMQAESGISRKFGGSGLGLAISRQLVELMGGCLSLVSEVGKGSCFYFSLTLERAEGAQAWAADTQLEGRRAHLEVASRFTRKSLTGLLASLGMELVEDIRKCDVILLGPEKNPGDYVLWKVPLVRVGMESCDGVSGLLRLPLRRNILQRALGRVLAGESAMDLEPALPSAGTRDFERKSPDASAPFVLVADDSLPNLKLMQALLWEKHLNSELAENGLQALEWLNKRSFDLILMDCQMPEMDGLEAARAYRLREKGDGHTPIIAVTANTSEDIRKKCLEAGMDDFLIKPVQLEKLEALLAKWLGYKAARPQATLSGPSKKLSSRVESTLPLLDAKTAGPLRQLPGTDGKTLFQMVCELFLRDADARGRQIVVSLENGLHADLVRAAHAMRGSAGNIGLKALHNLCGELELLGHEKRMDEAKTFLPAFMELLERSRCILLEELDSGSSKRGAEE